MKITKRIHGYALAGLLTAIGLYLAMPEENGAYRTMRADESAALVGGVKISGVETGCSGTTCEDNNQGKCYGDAPVYTQMIASKKKDLKCNPGNYVASNPIVVGKKCVGVKKDGNGKDCDNGAQAEASCSAVAVIYQNGFKASETRTADGVTTKIWFCATQINSLINNPDLKATTCTIK